VTSDLTAVQCIYYSSHGANTICHATGSPTNPVVKTKVSTLMCSLAHARHPHDTIAVNGDCGPNACLAAGAPCDETRPCCDGLSCQYWDGEELGDGEVGWIGLGWSCRQPACAFPMQICDGACTSVSTDPNNCGACGSVCGEGETCCEGTCFDLQTELDHCGSCSTACAAPTTPECAAATCGAGACGFSFQPAGTAVAAQTAGDCRINQCDGGDAIAANVDDTDLPVDGNPCTDDVCVDGAPANPPSAAGTACGVDLVCDGQGACVDCVTAADCPAAANGECATATCTAGVCGFDYQPAGTAVAIQVPGDCHVLQCDGAGSIVDAVADTDVPNDDNACTADVCAEGVASNPPVVAETGCGAGMVCDGAGACVGCVTAGNCPAPSNLECGTATCVANTCGFDYRPAGTLVAGQQAGDCHARVCDGGGGIVDWVDDADPPIDGIECTDDVCAGGLGSNPPTSAESPCGLGGMCDGSGACVECVRAGNCPEPAEPQCAAAACILGTCGLDYQPAGTALTIQAPGDCMERRCDGAGQVVDAIDDTDVPIDHNPCTDDACAFGVPSNPPVISGGSCGNDMLCDGAGTCVLCLGAQDCPPPGEPECAVATCTLGDCGFDLLPAGTPVSGQSAGDCLVRVCDGNGSVVAAPDELDVPVDTNPCTDDACAVGVPGNQPSAVGTPCGSGSVCNGQGACVGCMTEATCPPPPNPQCAVATCTGNVCGASTKPDGAVCNTSGTCTGGLCCMPSAPVITTSTNPSMVAVPGTGGNLGSPYPSVINVADLQGSVVKVTVTLHVVTHSFPDDIDLLLVGPTGAKVLLWSDVGGSNVTGFVNRTVTLDDAAQTLMPDESLFSSGTFRPTNIGPNDAFPAPAPSGPYATSLSAFNNLNPNGQWRLFAFDDVGLGGGGSIGQGWTLQLTLQQPAVCQ
jgi:hypothetical protein